MLKTGAGKSIGPQLIRQVDSNHPVIIIVNSDGNKKLGSVLPLKGMAYYCGAHRRPIRALSHNRNEA